jgi:hypothetical protein
VITLGQDTAALDDRLLNVADCQLHIEIVDISAPDCLQPVEQGAQVVNRPGALSFSLNSSKFVF